jgi:hypothetical protein
MNAFAKAARNQTTRTTNGMKALKSTTNPCVDLFYKIGASRGKNVLPDFIAAYVQDKELACRIALWARDIRGGAGEREIFRSILTYLSEHNPNMASRLVLRTPELGRWDDIFATSGEARNIAIGMVRRALATRDGLAAKWMPRKGPLAIELRNALGFTPKQYRKTLVNLSSVVESQMCAKDWDNINFNHVPSVASSRYKKAFNRNTPKYKEWTSKLVSTDPKVRQEVKINAGAVYPYDVLKGKINHYESANYRSAELNAILAQWEALPNFMNDSNVLPLVDVSGSMTTPVGGGGNLTCLDVAVSLGLYCADKNKGALKDMFLTFSARPELLTLKGNIIQKIDQMLRSEWEMNTNLVAALELILRTATNNSVPQEDMPSMLLILSDMQFDQCSRFDNSAMESIRRQYQKAGYQAPKIVFWNLNSHDNVPVKENEDGVALVSGFSPSILKSVLSADLEQFTPEAMMMKTLMAERYDF